MGGRAASRTTSGTRPARRPRAVCLRGIWCVRGRMQRCSLGLHVHAHYIFYANLIDLSTQFEAEGKLFEAAKRLGSAAGTEELSAESLGGAALAGQD